MKNLAACWVMLFLVGCSAQNEQLSAVDTSRDPLVSGTIAEAPNDSGQVIDVSKAEKAADPYEEKIQYFGTVYHSVINNDNVNIRRLPSLSGDVLFTVHNGTRIRIEEVLREQADIDNHSGYWLKIAVYDNQPNQWKGGWIFSKYRQWKY